MEWCFGSLPISHLTFFGVSTENFQKRPQELLDPVLRSVEWLLRTLKSDERIAQKKVKVRFIGCTDLFPSEIRDLINDLEHTTSANNNYFLTVCAPFGGKQEIVDAARRIASLADSQRIAIEDITEELFEKNLDTACLPNIDLLIRTAERRISNFALWKLAYSEIYFFEKFFPDLMKEDLDGVLKSFSKTERRYGGASKQMHTLP
jgi:undecaprenyl diphosphate synthase